MSDNELAKTLHPMTVGDILDRSIQLYRGNFLKFTGIVLLVKGPYVILSYILVELIEVLFTVPVTVPGEDAVQPLISAVSYTASLGIRLLGLILVEPVVIAAMTMAISERFLNRDIGVKEAYKRILKRFLPLLGTILLTGVIISSALVFFIFLGLSMLRAGGPIGFFLVMIGGIIAGILWIWFAFIAQTVVIEGEGGVSAMKRSKYLVKGQFIKAFVLLVLVYMVIILITSIISFGIMKSIFFLGHYSRSISEGTSNVISMLFEPFRIAAITLLYYDFRIRKEGFDLEVMAEELEANIKGE